MKQNSNCSVCKIFKTSKEKREVIDNINHVISKSTIEKDVEGLFDSVDLNSNQIPTWNCIKKHRDNCLKNIDIPKETNQQSNICNVQYTDYTDVSSGDIQRILRTKLLLISAKLIDHVEYELMDFSKAKPNIKDTVTTLKTTIDLMGFTIQENLENKGKLPMIFIEFREDKFKNKDDLYESDDKIYKKVGENKVEFVGYKSPDGKIVKKENIDN